MPVRVSAVCWVEMCKGTQKTPTSDAVASVWSELVRTHFILTAKPARPRRRAWVEAVSMPHHTAMLQVWQRGQVPVSRTVHVDKGC